MSPQRLLFVMVFVFYEFQVNAKICEDIHATTSVEHLEKKLRGCTVVLGNLKIVLMHDHYIPSKLISYNVTFPELTEITGFLLLYRVFGLRSIGKLFPNLTVIRGHTLLADSALVIYHVPNLQEIGLYNLRQIERGSTRINYCPQLCFVDTVDWTEIGGSSHDLHYYNENENDCAFCPADCYGRCWNTDHCQNSHEDECDFECLSCRQSDPGQCNACSSLYLDEGRCVSDCPENKLRNSETRTCITQQECFSILPGIWWIFNKECMRKCPEGYKRVTEEEGWCSYCGDDCYEKICDGGKIDSLWKAEFFRDCTHIKGSLNITVNNIALAHELGATLGKLKEIEGYLHIYRSHAISSLNFMRKLKLIRGNELWDGKYSLLVLENENLRRLWDWSSFALKIERGTIFFHYNPALCLSEIDKLVDVAGIPNNYSVTEVSPYSNGDRTVCRYINFNFSIISLSSTNMAITWEKPVVEADDVVVGYTFHYIEDPLGNITLAYGLDECFEDSWVSTFIIDNNYHTIHDLSPYTQYAFYIQIYTPSLSSGGQTAIQHFRTLSGYPSEPQNVKVVLTTTDSIILAWDPPMHPGGIITHYIITFDLLKDDLHPHTITANNYCFQPRYFSEKVNVDEPLEVWTNSSCCKRQKWQEWKRFKRSHPSSYITELQINGNYTRYELKNLKNFKIYTVMLHACNDLPGCSSATLIYQRTQPKEDADDIPPGLSVTVNNGNIFVKWPEPTNPNSIIPSYLVEYRKLDLKDSVNTLSCITRQDYEKGGYGYTISLLPGNYSLNVKAVSFAGEGRVSKNVYFEIPIVETVQTQHSTLPYLITVTIVIVVAIFSALFYYYRCKKKNWMLLTNSYSVESLYAGSQYELLREDVEVDVMNQTVEGTFGRIYNGFIKSQNRPCTVKFTQKYSERRELVKFLKGAATMKTFNSYHVVNLLGFVSTGQPALLVMELMAWGDLKSFLRDSKDSPTKLTHGEMYRMAAEIADGMTYLSSKKFIHLDLAARNCLVSAGHTVKIVNFGINSDLYKTDYYKKNSGEVIPVRWMAPESLADGIFTNDSNVWSYGIVLWEIVTFAEQPYRNLLDEQVMRYVIGQHVLDPPLDCPELLYEIMVACWRWRSKHRPIFVNLLKQLQSRVRRDFRLVSFYHSREAREYKLSAKNREYNLPARRIPLLDERQAARWSKQDDEVQLCPTDELIQYQRKSVPSTSSLI